MSAAEIAKICESLMMVAFGASWPMNLIKTIRMKDPRSKSFVFLWLILLGYLAGVTSKIIKGEYISYLTALYVLNTLMVATDLVLSTYYLMRLKRQQKKA